MSLILGEVTIGRILAAGTASAIIALVIAYIVIAWLFHDYQKLTPATWRPEGPREYTLSSCVYLLNGFGFAILFAMTGTTLTSRIGHWLPAGLIFGLTCFVALSLPVILSDAIFINIHRGFVIGSLLSSLLTCLACGVICAALI
ncbi:MAG TPA: hypothetical protein VGZ22_31795 [Isosphaeraceae bacterium]|nr:hypothetical protein [Isosphaeraceae bacterium]